jgi:mannosyl-oligosaccharide alpha-1,2-mannosidase
MQHAWNGYANQAFGADEVGPVSGSRYQKVWGDMGVTLVDALDTLYIMGLEVW